MVFWYEITHYTNLHTFKQHPSICTEENIKLRLSYAFADFRNIAKSVVLELGLNHAKLKKIEMQARSRDHLFMKKFL